MTLAAFRDLVISIAGLVFIAVLIWSFVLCYSLYHRAKPTLEMMQKAAETWQGFGSCLCGISSVVQGFNMWANLAANLFGRRGGKKK